ncbi:unnamed protein product [Paramecium sonneborni]|uniref:Uncharacterized protein n=1 Tax=Paramecium sonneborni TaxID=65129 RepID=A0A8S1QIN5_9CILI|nr:unnamed protein product [Paramecium sonneborni]
MHKNQSFIILMIRWLLEYYRYQFKIMEFYQNLFKQ